jgi:hypothetical protein
MENMVPPHEDAARQPQVIFHSEYGDIDVDGAAERCVYQMNHLLGPIPGTIGSVTGLKILSLSKNNLTGELPLVLEDLHQLESLQIDYNPGLTGAIHREILGSAFLQRAHFAACRYTSFDGRDLKNENANITIYGNPLVAFTPPSVVQAMRLRPNQQGVHIHFDGHQIDREEALMHLHGVLQGNVLGNHGVTDTPLRIGFYQGGDNNAADYNISNYLQGLGVTHNTVIIKDQEGAITVEGLAEGYDTAQFITLLNQVRGDMLLRYGKTKSARN